MENDRFFAQTDKCVKLTQQKQKKVTLGHFTLISPDEGIYEDFKCEEDIRTNFSS